MSDNEYTYKVSIFESPDEDGRTPNLIQGEFRLQVPFESDEEVLKCIALEQAGVLDSDKQDSFTIENADSGGFVIRDADAVPFLGLELEDETTFEEDEDLISFGTFDDGTDAWED
jgi:hypothetical protein